MRLFLITRWNGQVANMGRGSLGGQGGLQVGPVVQVIQVMSHLQVNGWLQGQVQARGEVRADLSATYTRCLFENNSHVRSQRYFQGHSDQMFNSYKFEDRGHG